MGFRLQQNLMTLNDLERQFTALSSLVSVMRIVAERLRIELRHKVTLHPRLSAY